MPCWRLASTNLVQPWVKLVAGPQQAVVAVNSLVKGLTPLKTLHEIEFPRDVGEPVTDEFGSRHSTVLGRQALARFLPLSELATSPSGSEDSPVSVVVWINQQGTVSRFSASGRLLFCDGPSAPTGATPGTTAANGGVLLGTDGEDGTSVTIATTVGSPDVTTGTVSGAVSVTHAGSLVLTYAASGATKGSVVLGVDANGFEADGTLVCNLGFSLEYGDSVSNSRYDFQALSYLDPTTPSAQTYVMNPSRGYGPGVRTISPVEPAILADLGYTVTPNPF